MLFKEKMLFKDVHGRILVSDQVDEMPIWEIEELGLRLYDDDN